MARCRHPISPAGRVPQFSEKAGGVVGIGRRIEGLFQGRKGGWVVHEVDLCTAYIDGLDAA
jgi:hypothetical protein